MSSAEPEIRAMLPQGVTALVTRLALRGSSEAELRGMMAGVETAATLLSDARVDRIVFHCTAVTTFSASAGRVIRDRITAASGVRGLVTSDAILGACRVLKLRRLVLLTPYAAAVHQREIDFLKHNDIEVAHDSALNINTNEEMAQLTPGRLQEWILQHRADRADGYFVSCTALRTAGLIAPLEAALGRPVITSNQVMVWHALRDAANVSTSGVWGRLMTC